MDASLHLSPDAYRTVLECLPTAVYIVDRERRIVFWNDGCERLTGHLRHEVIGRSCSAGHLMHCDENHDLLCGVACPLLETMRDGRPLEADLYLLHRDGYRLPIHAQAVAVRDEHGAIIGACECFTERQAALPVPRSLDLVMPLDSIDPASQLPDHDSILRRVAALLREFETSHIPFGVICFEIANFDTLSAADGANALHHILFATGRTLANALGAANRVGRWSERQFLALVRGCSPMSLRDSAAALQRLAALEAVPWWGDYLSVTLSAGTSVVSPGDTADDLVERAVRVVAEGCSTP